MIPARKVVFGAHPVDHVFTDWSSLEVRNDGINITVDLEPLHERLLVDPISGVAVERGDEITVLLGRVLPGLGPKLKTKASGKIVDMRRVITDRGDAIRLTVDGVGGRFLVAPDVKLVYEGWRIEDILDDIYKSRLGFHELQTNLPRFFVPHFEVDVSTPLHAAVQRLLAGFAPKTFVDYSESENAGLVFLSRISIFDTRRRIPALPTARLTPASWTNWSDETPPPTIVNSVLVSYLTDAASPGPHEFTDEWVDHTDPNAAPGSIAPRQETLVRKYREDAENPDRVTREVPIKTRTTDYDDQGDEAAKTETDIEYVPNTYDSITRQTVSKKWLSVSLPGGGRDLKLCRTETRTWAYEKDLETGELVPVSETWAVDGEIVYPERIPLDEASRAKLVDLGTRQHMDPGPIEHGHISYSEAGAETHWTKQRRDDLSGEWYPTETGKLPTRQRQKPALGVETFLVEDDASIEADGRRPQVTFDGTMYGPELAEELVRLHLFGGFSAVEPAATTTLLYPDPFIVPGALFAVDDREGERTTWLVTATSDTDAPAERSTETRLTLVRVETVAA